jgi:hypothetical protein
VTPQGERGTPVPSQNAIGLEHLKSATFKKKKLTPDQLNDQDVTMLHCAENRWTEFLRSTGCGKPWNPPLEMLYLNIT